MDAKLVGACLARNEAAPGRYLKLALENAKALCDEVVLLDDGSTDATVSVARDLGCIVVERGGDGWWGGAASQTEAPARQALWELARQQAGDGGWIYVLDADHELLGITRAELHACLRSTLVDAWACPLWDAWSPDGRWHRIDGYWQAWRSPRPWIFKALQGAWAERAIHVGHAPQRAWTVGLLPQGAGVLHWGYAERNARLRKLRQYATLNEPTEATCLTQESLLSKKPHTRALSLTK